MSLSTVCVNVFESLHILRNLPPKRSLDDVTVVDLLGDRRELLISKRVGSSIWINASLRQNLRGALRANSVNVLKRKEDLLFIWDVDSGDTWHGVCSPSLRCELC